MKELKLNESERNAIVSYRLQKAKETLTMLVITVCVVILVGCKKDENKEQEVETWQFTPTLSATLYDNGTLIISGEGAIPDYNVASPPPPWFQYRNDLFKVIIENGVTSIGVDAFFGCESITSITIPRSVTTIGYYAFCYCSSLTSITNLNPEPVEIYPVVFFKVNQSACTLYVPVNAVSAYQNAEVWKEFNIVGI